jgi:hypothetical protein
MNPMKMMGDADKLSIPQLQQSIQNGTIPAYIGVPLLQEKVKQQKAMQASMAAPQGPAKPPVAQQVMQEAQGVSALPSNLAPEGYADGGIVAFAGREGSYVDGAGLYDYDIETLRKLESLRNRQNIDSINSIPYQQQEGIDQPFNIAVPKTNRKDDDLYFMVPPIYWPYGKNEKRLPPPEAMTGEYVPADKYNRPLDSRLLQRENPVQEGVSRRVYDYLGNESVSTKPTGEIASPRLGVQSTPKVDVNAAREAYAQSRMGPRQPLSEAARYPETSAYLRNPSFTGQGSEFVGPRMGVETGVGAPSYKTIGAMAGKTLGALSAPSLIDELTGGAPDDKSAKEIKAAWQEGGVPAVLAYENAKGAENWKGVKQSINRTVGEPLSKLWYGPKSDYDAVAGVDEVKAKKPATAWDLKTATPETQYTNAQDLQTEINLMRRAGQNSEADVLQAELDRQVKSGQIQGSPAGQKNAYGYTDTQPTTSTTATTSYAPSALPPQYSINMPEFDSEGYKALQYSPEELDKAKAINEAKSFYGVDPEQARLAEKIKGREADLAKDKDKAPWMALMQAGLATMAGTSPFALTNIGAGGQAGLEAFAKAKDKLDNTQDKLYDMQARLADKKRAEELSAINHGISSVEHKEASNRTAKQAELTTKADYAYKKAHIGIQNAELGIKALQADYMKDYYKQRGLGTNKYNSEQAFIADILDNRDAPANAKYFDPQGNFDRGKALAEYNRLKKQNILDVSNGIDISGSSSIEGSGPEADILRKYGVQ